VSAARPVSQPPLGVLGRARLLVTIWALAIRVTLALRSQPLPDLVDRLGDPDGTRPRPPALLGRAVSRGLRIGPWVPRCIIRSLVLYRLLRAQGDEPELVIGLPHERATRDAHAWVLLAGRDVGPEPGAAGHLPLARYPTDRAR
jgi:hypothetical protein